MPNIGLGSPQSLWFLITVTVDSASATYAPHTTFGALKLDNGTWTLFSYLQKNNNFLANYLHLNYFQDPLFWPWILNFPGYPHMFKVGSYSLLRNLKNANIWNALDWKSAQQLKTVCQVCQHL